MAIHGCQISAKLSNPWVGFVLDIFPFCHFHFTAHTLHHFRFPFPTVTFLFLAPSFLPFWFFSLLFPGDEDAAMLKKGEGRLSCAWSNHPSPFDPKWFISLQLHKNLSTHSAHSYTPEFFFSLLICSFSLSDPLATFIQSLHLQWWGCRFVQGGHMECVLVHTPILMLILSYPISHDLLSGDFLVDTICRLNYKYTLPFCAHHNTVRAWLLLRA